MSRAAVLFLVAGGGALAALAAVAGLFTAVRYLGLDLNSFVPSEQDIRGRGLDEFLVDDSELQGLYGNRDVPTVVFEYRTSCTDRQQFAGRVNVKATAKGWKRVPDVLDALRFQRFKEGWGPVEVRLRLDSDTHMVMVAWVCGTSSRPVASFDDAKEASWAQRVVWPLLYE